jgi:dihydrofolate reductase
MKKSIIVAMAENRVIGRNNKLPWYLPNDLKYFKSVTMGKPIIMGRKTFESIGKPLPGRLNIVITRNTEWQHEGVTVVHSLDEAFVKAEATALIDGVDEVMIIGGANIYQQMLSKAARLFLTFIDLDVEGDTYFPDWQGLGFQETASEQHQPDEKNPHSYRFVTLEK